MEDDTRTPSLDAFLDAPASQVARVAPPTVIFAVGGTRRSAELSLVASDSEEYARFSRERMVRCFDSFFQLGVRHLFTSVLRPGQLDEVGRYRERLVGWMDWGLAGAEALDDYQRRGWRVRLMGAEHAPELQPLAERLVAATPAKGKHTLWLYVAPQRGALWAQLLSAAHLTGAATQEALIEALFGEALPAAGMYIGFGKPLITNDIVPLALCGETQCYWIQRPGYELDEAMLRRMIYDYAYLRNTWVEDKTQRYAQIQAQRAHWESRAILGLGIRVGDFWYPETSFGADR
jgi:hypothetical protein